MTDTQRLQIALSEKRARVAALLALEKRTPEEAAELRELPAGISDLSDQLAASTAVEASAQAAPEPGAPAPPAADAQERERLALRGRSRLGAFLMAAPAWPQCGGGCRVRVCRGVWCSGGYSH